MLKIEITVDPATRQMNIVAPQLDFFAIATLCSQAVTQALMMDQNQRALLINPLSNNGFKSKGN